MVLGKSESLSAYVRTVTDITFHSPRVTSRSIVNNNTISSVCQLNLAKVSNIFCIQCLDISAHREQFVWQEP
jgi:hypothetical protein